MYFGHGNKFWGLHIDSVYNKLLYWNNNCNPFLFLASIGLFNLARNHHFVNTIINKISGLSLLVYLVHENHLVKIYLRPYIWQKIYTVFGYDYVVFWVFAQVLMIFVVSLMVCFIYKLTFKKITDLLASLAYAAAKLQSNRSSPTPRPLKSDTLSAGPTVGVVSVETGLFVSLHAA